MDIFTQLTGTVVNSAAIIVGSGVGRLFSAGVVQKYQESILQAVSLAIILIGIKGALQTDDLLIVIISLALGAVFGEFLQIEARLQAFGKWIEVRFSRSGEGFAKAFVTTSLMYCIGSMAIVGSLESGLAGNHQILFAKAILDGIISIVFCSLLGIGVMFSALPVFVYQAAITLSASLMQRFLIPEVVGQMSAVGGLLIMAIGLNMLELTKLKVGNMLPSVFLPLLYFVLRQLFGL